MSTIYGSDAENGPFDGTASSDAPIPAAGQGSTLESQPHSIGDPVLSGYVWQGSVTYSFATAATNYEPSIAEASNGFGTVSFAQQQAIRFILEGSSSQAGGPAFHYGSFESLILLSISEVANPADGSLNTADIRVAQSSLPNPTAYAYYPAPDNGGPTYSGDVWFGTQTDYSNPLVGSTGWHAAMHELGHAFGLKHGHETDVYGALPADRDSLEFSVMTYRSYVGGPPAFYMPEEFGGPQTLMMYDIAALQEMYGADFATNATDTTYTWNPTTGEMSLNGVGQGAPGGNRIFLTTWDGGGNDTYDFSNYVDLSAGSHPLIDLRPGAWTNLTTQVALLDAVNADQYAHGNIYNAFLYHDDARSYIENAIGTASGDVINGNDIANLLQGGDGDDTLYGGAGDDMLLGGAGNDVLDGGPGNDYMDGGPGDDTYVIDSATDAFYEVPGAGRDLVRSSINFTLFDGPDDLELVGPLALKGVGNNAANALYGSDYDNTLDGYFGDDTVYGGGGNDTLSGSAGNDALDGGAGNDQVYGGDNNDTVYGGPGNDQVFGDDGNDTLYGGAGLDQLSGGKGDDTYYVDSTDTAYDGPNGGGLDTAIAIGSGFALTAGGGIEKLILTDAAITAFGSTDGETIIGSDLANTIFGQGGKDTLLGELGNDTIIAGNDNDVIDGGGGDDYLYGGDGDDTYFIDSSRDVEADTAGNDTVIASASVTLGFGIETLTLTGSAPLDGTGNGSDNLIVGNDAANTLDGWGGHDTLYGAGGNDVLVGGYGNPTLYGGDGSDEFRGSQYNDVAYGGNDGDSAALSGGADTAFGGDGDDVLNGEQGADRLSGDAGSDTLFGGDDADVLFGGADDDRLSGDSGDDTLAGGSGNDSLDGGAGNDTLDFSQASGVDGAVVVDLALGTVSGAHGNDTVANFEAVIGSAADDTIVGGAGGELLYGALGDDSLYGGAGSDTLVGGLGNDELYGGADSDTASYAGASASVSVNLNLGTATGADGSDHLFEIENVVGSSFNDVITGTTGDNMLWGGAGNDSLNGLAGNDVMSGDAGDDSLNGSTGDDTLSGGAGNDSINGGNDNDLISGGAGNDTLVGGVGIDTLDYSQASGVDSTVTVDFAHGTVIGANGRDVVSGFEAVIGSSFADRMTGSAAAETFWGMAGNDTLYGGDGNDLLVGGDGNDALYGGTGDDTLSSDGGANYKGTSHLEGGDGNDTLIGGPAYDALDTAYYSSAAGSVVVDLAAGTATGQGNDTLFSIESAVGSGFADTMSGSNAANTLIGAGGDDTLDGGVGNDQLDGGDGNDVLYGGPGDDVIAGGAGADTFYFTNAGHDTFTDFNPGEGDVLLYGFAGAQNVTITALGNILQFDVDGVLSTITAPNYTWSGLEPVNVAVGDGLEGPNTLFGGSAADTFYGGAGNDSLYGGDGDDTLYGGTGDDTLSSDGGLNYKGVNYLEGGDGNDTLIGGPAYDALDTALYLNATAFVVVDLAAGIATGQGEDRLFGIESVVGSGFGDTIFGSDAANTLVGAGGDDTLDGAAGDDRLDGGDGNDVLHGGPGDDVLAGGAGADTFYFTNASHDTLTDFNPDEGDKLFFGFAGAQHVSITASGHVLQFDVDGVVSSITAPNYVWNGLEPIALVDGSDGDNTLTGGSAADTFYGGTGNDVLTGGDGNDMLYGGAGDDTLSSDGGLNFKGTNFLEGGDGNDLLIGGPAYDALDTASYANASGSVVVDLAAGTATGQGTDTLYSIESVIGSGFADTIIGNDAANTLIGGGGDDTMAGGLGDDTLVGGDGNDIFAYSFDGASLGNDILPDFDPDHDAFDFNFGAAKDITIIESGNVVQIILDGVVTTITTPNYTRPEVDLGDHGPIIVSIP